MPPQTFNGEYAVKILLTPSHQSNIERSPKNMFARFRSSRFSFSRIALPKRLRRPVLFLFAAALAAHAAGAAEYQFGVTLPPSTVNPSLYAASHFFLYIPPQTPRVRAVLWAPANIIERRLCDDPALRAEAARDGIAIVFFQAGWRKDFFNSPDLVRYLQTAADELAARSGYSEIATAPWIPIGHSGNSQFVQGVDRQAPARVVAGIVIKGAVPAVGPDGSTSGLEGIPLLTFTGEYEEVMPPGKVRNGWWPVTVQRFLDVRQAVPHALLSCMLDRDHGHVGWDDRMTGYLTLFLHKAIAARLSSGGALRSVSFESGWLGDPAETFATAPVSRYKGDPGKAFWFFDEEQARAWESLFRRDEHKQDQMIAFLQDGKAADWWNGWALQGIRFDPLPDGESFRVQAVPRQAVPEPFSDAGRPLGHNTAAKIQYKVVGWASQTLQTGADTFRVAFDREGVNGRTTHILIGASLASNETYKDATAVATLDVPTSNNEGLPQTIDFPPLADIAPVTATVPLHAATNTHRRVDYYISYGPAQIVDGMLQLTPIPVRAKFPIEVSVTAYQWGTASGERFQTAKPVTRTFLIQDHKSRP